MKNFLRNNLLKIANFWYDISVIRREYSIDIVVNGVKVKKVIIDPHYEERHADSITDEVILKLVSTLDREEHQPDKVISPYSYFKKDRIRLGNKIYRLVWLLEDHDIYIGVVNAYRR